jgi:hypothetical protein
MPEVLQRSRTLYELSNDLTDLELALEDMDLTDEQQQEAIAIYLAGSAGDELKVKIGNYVGLMRECEARSEARAKEAALISKGAHTYSNMAKRLKSSLCEFMDAHNYSKFETDRYTVVLQANGGVAPLIVPENLDASTLPEVFRVVTYQPNTAAIREALESGTPTPEYILCGITLGKRGKHLRVR